MENQEPKYQKKEQKKQDALLFPGGPLESVVETWKEKYGEVFLTELSGEYYIWRPLNRYEYKQIINSTGGISPLQREEVICQNCILWPTDFDEVAMANGKAGVPSVLAEQIMEISGFDDSAVPQPL